MKNRLYHLYAVNARKGWRECVTAYPVPHAEALRLRARFTAHPARRLVLVESATK
jgi:hypothetical protein